MKKASFIFLLLCNSFCFSQTTKLVPLYVLLPSYTQVQEDSIALTYNVSEPGVTNQNIWNSDLLKTRIWNGTEFTSVPDLPARSLPVASQTSPGAVPQTGIPTGKYLKDDLTWGAASGISAWGGIIGTLSAQTDLQTALNAKQGTVTTGTTSQYFRGDLSLATFPTTTASFTNSTNKNFVTDAQLTVIGNTSGTNSGDNSVNTLYSGLAASKQNVITLGTTAQYFRGDLSLSTFPTTTAAFSNSADKNFLTDAKLTVINNTTGTNSGDNAVNTTYANDFRVANFVAGTNYLAPNGSAAALTNFPTFNQNTSGTAAGLSSVLNFANGGISAAAATPATTGVMTVSMATSVITITPTGACTFNASGGVAGQRVTFAITTSGTTSFVLTFGTNFRKVGTLATGTVSARFFSVTFICINGTTWQEIARTAAQT